MTCMLSAVGYVIRGKLDAWEAHREARQEARGDRRERHPQRELAREVWHRVRKHVRSNGEFSRNSDGKYRLSGGLTVTTWGVRAGVTASVSGVPENSKHDEYLNIAPAAEAYAPGVPRWVPTPWTPTGAYLGVSVSFNPPDTVVRAVQGGSLPWRTEVGPSKEIFYPLGMRQFPYSRDFLNLRLGTQSAYAMVSRECGEPFAADRFYPERTMERSCFGVYKGAGLEAGPFVFLPALLLPIAYIYGGTAAQNTVEAQ